MAVKVLVGVLVTVKVGEHPLTQLVTGLDVAPGILQPTAKSVSLAWLMIVTQDWLAITWKLSVPEPPGLSSPISHAIVPPV